MKMTNDELCRYCCEWVHDQEDKSPLAVAESYPKMMRKVLRDRFHMSKKAAQSFIDDACCGNWERMHETHIEKQVDVKEYVEALVDDVWYSSDRWSWDRVIRIQWFYKRIVEKCARKEIFGVGA